MANSARRFLLSGSIVDVDSDKETLEDVTPTQLNSYIKGLGKGEPLNLDITSYGGSVTAGLAIVNLIRQAQRDGHETIAHVIGIAASMASVIACACDRLIMDSSAFLMCHLPWTISQGNSIDLRKQADVLDRYRDAMVSVYRSKFDMTDEQIIEMLNRETWIPADGCGAYGLKAEIIDTDEPLKIAALLKNEMPKFMNAPKSLMEKLDMRNKIKKAEEEIEKKEVVEEETEEVTEEKEVTEEEKSEENKEDEEKETEKPDNVEVTEEKEVTEEEKTDEEEKPEELDEDDEEEEKKSNMVTKAECEKRVSGMQSTMAKKIDEMRKSYEAKISEFEIKVKAMSEELEKVKAESTSLKTNLEKTESELSIAISALDEKKNALDALNARVNTPDMIIENKPWKKLHGEALLKWCRENPVR